MNSQPSPTELERLKANVEQARTVLRLHCLLLAEALKRVERNG